MEDDRDELEAVSESLWRERHLLGRLVFKLAVVRALLAAEAYEWLPVAADETIGLVEELDQLGRRRTPLPWLRTLAATTPAPWDHIFAEHGRSLLDLRRRVRVMASETMRGLAGATESMAAEV